jgi:hypothetical protein
MAVSIVQQQVDDHERALDATWTCQNRAVMQDKDALQMKEAMRLNRIQVAACAAKGLR